MPWKNYNKFQPKKPVRSFRDLEVYQKTMEASVIIVKDLRPGLVKQKYPFLENMVNCSMTVPLHVAEAHSLRFASLDNGVKLLEQAMAGCNKMVVYLEQLRGMYGSKIDGELMEDLIGRYIGVRGKMFRLEKSWKNFSRDREPPPRPLRY